MSECKYLYGAAVQGIQGYIFRTNELKDIVDASEQVLKICTDLFQDTVNTLTGHYDENAAIIHAAGNIKYEFASKEDCEKVVKFFPKMVVEYAPGITISQAVECYHVGDQYVDAINNLEDKLRWQRNKPMASITLGLMGIQRNANTNLPVICMKKTDKGQTTNILCRRAFGFDVKDGQIAYDIEKITGDNDWIAVIHADGNGLGKVVQQYGNNREKFKEFSDNLNQATITAAQAAYNAVSSNFKPEKPIPIRPIVLGGDDFTVICRANIALPYVKTFIEQFEIETERRIGIRLTACAGIAYTKSSFPFYYGYELAESLCSFAKKETKAINNTLAPSCIQFHKIQDSFIEDYKDIIARELSPAKNISLQFGPYYLQEQTGKWTIYKLISQANLLDKDGWNPVKTALRQWLTLLMTSREKAQQKKLRIVEMVTTEQEQYVNNLTNGITKGEDIHYPVYDVLTVHTINTQNTKGKEATI